MNVYFARDSLPRRVWRSGHLLLARLSDVMKGRGIGSTVRG